MMLTKSDLVRIKKKGDEKGLAKLALACVASKGVRLTWQEVREIFEMDDALHQRLYNELDRLFKEATP